MIRRNIAPLLGILVVLAAALATLALPPKRPGTSAPVVMGEPIPAIIELPLAPALPLLRYIAIEESCGPGYEGACVRARSGPGTEYPVALRLRTGTVLRVADVIERDGATWYRIAFDEWLRYPERARSLYVAADLVRAFEHAGPVDLIVATTSTKRIVVDRGDQTLTAYDGGELVMRVPVSTGITATPTPRGTFTIFRKTPTRYMQGPIPGISAKEYDLPGVPWDMYFTKEGAAIHGAYWHDSFGSPHSNGCVNLAYADAEKLYAWADIGTTVIVRD